MKQRVVTDMRFFQDHNGNLTGIQVKTAPLVTHYPQGDYGSEDDERFLVVVKGTESEWTEVTTEGIKDE